jgi:formamidopyrimidine-DNA glycosylase
MPELPDVEIFKRYMNATSLHQSIEGVVVNSTKVLKSVSAKRLKSQLRNRSFESTMRYGK